MIYVIRHATAESDSRGSDRERCLTEKGRREARRVGMALRKLGNAVDVILSSPAERAFQTAGLIAAELDPAPAIETEQLLYGAGGFGDLLRLLEANANRSVALVGHMPDVSQLVAATAGASVTFLPSTVCCLDAEEGGWRLIWHRTPSDLALLAGEDQA